MRYKSLLWKLYFLLYSFPSIEWSDRRRYFSIPRGVHNYRAQGKNVLIKRNKIIPKENPDKLSLFLVGLCNSVIKLVSSSYFQEFCQSLWRTPNQKYKQNSTALTSLKTMNWCWRKNFPNISRWDKMSTLRPDKWDPSTADNWGHCGHCRWPVSHQELGLYRLQKIPPRMPGGSRHWYLQIHGYIYTGLSLQFNFNFIIESEIKNHSEVKIMNWKTSIRETWLKSNFRWHRDQ